MISFVLDASALVELAVSARPDGDLRRRTETGSGAAPELIDIEALQAIRGLVRQSRLDLDSAGRGATRIRRAPIRRVLHRRLLDRVWALRDTLTAYDAAYVALAEQLDVPLLTCDARLGRAHGHHAEVITYPRS